MTGPKRVTEKQLAANRANAQRSTGPRTPEGRDAVRYNALKHGILSQSLIPEAMAPYESREEFEELHATLRDEFAPANSVEELLVEQIATSFWRLARLYRAEAGTIAAYQDDAEERELRDEAMRTISVARRVSSSPSLKSQVDKLESIMSNKRDLRTFMVQLDGTLRDATDEEVRHRAGMLLTALRTSLQEEKEHKEAVQRAQSSTPPVDTALKFARYETALQNQLDRALSRLERLQRQRGGEFVTPPLQVDVTGLPLSDEET